MSDRIERAKFRAAVVEGMAAVMRAGRDKDKSSSRRLVAYMHEHHQEMLDTIGKEYVDGLITQVAHQERKRAAELQIKDLHQFELPILDVPPERLPPTVTVRRNDGEFDWIEFGEATFDDLDRYDRLLAEGIAADSVNRQIVRQVKLVVRGVMKGNPDMTLREAFAVLRGDPEEPKAA